MAQLITYVRGKIDDASSGDFTDDQIQQELDSIRQRFTRKKLDKDPPETLYLSPIGGYLEGVASGGTWSGASVIAIYDGPTAGATEITPDDWNLIDGSFTFTSDQNDVYYLSCWRYDPHYSAAMLLISYGAKKTTTAGWAESGGVVRSRTVLGGVIRDLMSLARPRTKNINRVYR